MTHKHVHYFDFSQVRSEGISVIFIICTIMVDLQKYFCVTIQMYMQKGQTSYWQHSFMYVVYKCFILQVAVSDGQALWLISRRRTCTFSKCTVCTGSTWLRLVSPYVDMPTSKYNSSMYHTVSTVVEMQLKKV